MSKEDFGWLATIRALRKPLGVPKRITDDHFWDSVKGPPWIKTLDENDDGRRRNDG